MCCLGSCADPLQSVPHVPCPPHNATMQNIADQLEARRAKNKAARERKAARREERFAQVRPTHEAMGSAAAKQTADGSSG